jgi:undecaprenyl-diphosphatase
VTGLFAALAPLDETVARIVAQATTPALADLMRVLSTAHTARGIAVLLAGACALLLALRDRAGALWLLLGFYSGAAINHALKHAIQRPRPGQAELAVTDFAFPSGHAAQATLLYGALLALLWRHTRSRLARGAAAAFAALMVLAVCTSRLVLQAHWFSDVVGGVLVGAAWLALALAVRRAIGR